MSPAVWRSASSRGPARRALASRRGGSASEFAIIGSLIFLMILAGMDLSRYYFTMHALRTAAADAARAAIINKTAADCGSGTVQTAARAGILGSSFTLTVTCPTASGVTTVSVTATRPFSFVLPVFGVSAMTLTERSSFSFAS